MCACWKSNYFHDMAECYREPDWKLVAKRGFHLFPKWFFMCKSVSLYMMLSRKVFVFRHPEFLVQLPSIYQLILMSNQVMINCINQPWKNVPNHPWPRHHLWPTKKTNSFSAKGRWNTPVLFYIFFDLGTYFVTFSVSETVYSEPLQCSDRDQ